MANCQGCNTTLPPKTWVGRDRKWCSETCRKRTLYSRRCVDCGAVCNTDGRVTDASERCKACAERRVHETRQWTPETVIAAINLWADRHGGVPPTATQWSAQTPSEFPYPSTVIREFGSWSAAITAAGFDAFTVGHYGRDGEDPAVLAETARLYRTGMTLMEVAEATGVQYETARQRLVRAGEPRRARFTGV